MLPIFHQKYGANWTIERDDMPITNYETKETRNVQRIVLQYVTKEITKDSCQIWATGHVTCFILGAGRPDGPNSTNSPESCRQRRSDGHGGAHDALGLLAQPRSERDGDQVTAFQLCNGVTNRRF